MLRKFRVVCGLIIIFLLVCGSANASDECLSSARFGEHNPDDDIFFTYLSAPYKWFDHNVLFYSVCNIGSGLLPFHWREPNLAVSKYNPLPFGRCADFRIYTNLIACRPSETVILYGKDRRQRQALAYLNPSEDTSKDVWINFDMSFWDKPQEPDRVAKIVNVQIGKYPVDGAFVALEIMWISSSIEISLGFSSDVLVGEIVEGGSWTESTMNDLLDSDDDEAIFSDFMEYKIYTLPSSEQEFSRVRVYLEPSAPAFEKQVVIIADPQTRLPVALFEMPSIESE